MSRAFTKEPDGDMVADDAPERPRSEHPNYVTPAGLAALEARRAGLAAERGCGLESIERHGAILRGRYRSQGAPESLGFHFRGLTASRFLCQRIL